MQPRAQSEDQEVQKLRSRVSKLLNYSCYAADFETTSYDDYLIDGQTRVYVWALQNICKSKIIVGNTIEEFISYLSLLPDESVVFFHNLKFDGKFILWYLLYVLKWEYGPNFCQFKTVITTLKEWFLMELHYPNGCTIYIKDSYKKFPGLSIESLSNMLNYGRKAPLDTGKRRDLNYKADADDCLRVTCDVDVLSYALLTAFDNGFFQDTASADAFSQFRRMLANSDDYLVQTFAFKRLYPSFFRKTDEQSADVNSMVMAKILEEKFRRGYYGGLCYVNPEYQGKLLQDVVVYDRNSMYPAVMVMHPLPFGRIRNREPGPNDLYIIEFEAIFKLKPGKIPFVQTKTNIYHQNEVITEVEEHLRLVFPSPLFDLFLENYDIIDLVVLDKWVFESRMGDFDKFVYFYYEQKKNASDPATRLLAKIRLNSLYGKLAQDRYQYELIPILEDGKIIYVKGEEHYRNILTFLPVSMFITGWARWDLVHVIQEFIYTNGSDFIYCDTDSVHVFRKWYTRMLLRISSKIIGDWKEEGIFAYAIYHRAKVYMHGDKDMNVVEIKAAGAPMECKKRMNFNNFLPNVEFNGKLTMLNVPGGCVLKETTYKIIL